MLKRLMIAAAALGLAIGVGTAHAQEKLKVGFINIGPKTDGGWTQGHWTGVQALEKELGDKIEVTLPRERARRPGRGARHRGPGPARQQADLHDLVRLHGADAEGRLRNTRT